MVNGIRETMQNLYRSSPWRPEFTFYFFTCKHSDHFDRHAEHTEHTPWQFAFIRKECYAMAFMTIGERRRAHKFVLIKYFICIEEHSANPFNAYVAKIHLHWNVFDVSQRRPPMSLRLCLWDAKCETRNEKFNSNQTEKLNADEIDEISAAVAVGVELTIHCTRSSNG